MKDQCPKCGLKFGWKPFPSQKLFSNRKWHESQVTVPVCPGCGAKLKPNPHKAETVIAFSALVTVGLGSLYVSSVFGSVVALIYGVCVLAAFVPGWLWFKRRFFPEWNRWEPWEGRLMNQSRDSTQ